MSTIWHIVKKDFRRFRWPLLALVAMWIFKAGLLVNYYARRAWPTVPTAFNSAEVVKMLSDSFLRGNSGWVTGVAFIGSFLDLYLLVYIVIHLLQADSAFADQAFWRTRPVSRKQMLAAKTLFLVAVAWGGPVLLQLVMDWQMLPLFYLKFGIHGYDGIVEVIRIQGIWAMTAMLVGSLWRSAIVGFGTLLGITLINSITTIALDYRDHTDLALLVEFIVIVGSGLVFSVMYLYGRRALGFILFGIGVGIILFLPELL